MVATTNHIYTLSLHDALPISEELDDHVFLGSEVPEEGAPGHAGGRDDLVDRGLLVPLEGEQPERRLGQLVADELDRKSTRLNSSHGYSSYAVFCSKRKTLRLM